ncbi:cob(I)yrinic acid a,c-diamide adenosyltransferase [Bacteroides caecigallinarum]|uniref:cob(I)yrinic acid a,c-diamide adenosyltransferase n=1 Tax=Bacteroides caecigallinarum TaxID=1411144 RepID=UPI001F453DD1|nr:cob(I)yrinic acid a,c-diamide adenosyltransferase [Bacteroides caecigallinarum]MCF2593791.1 cob(I)yrinic acid a,c-diamide adenosyltransferase [Bacteroides caecigallinarum]
MKKSLIYTKTGDKGTTSLVGGVRVSKTHRRLEAYGTVDELNSCLGMLISLIKTKEDMELLRYVQHKLFSLGAYLATDSSQTEFKMDSYIDDEDILKLENAIDITDSELSPLKGFVLPGGSYQASACHLCRTVCRRAERRILELEEENICTVDLNCKRFVNRLSDFLFVLSRKLNHLASIDEIYWDKTCK